MKATLVLLPALAAICHGAALPHNADIVDRGEGRNQWKRQVTIVVTKTTTKTTAPAVYTTSTKYTTLPTPVITKTSTITKPYTTPKDDVSTVIVTVTGRPTTVTPPVVTVTVTARTSSSAKPPVTVTVTVAPPGETEEPEEPSTTDSPWQITRTLPPLTFGKRDPSPAPEPEAEPQGWRGRPTRWGDWGPGGQTVVETQIVKETVTCYPPTSTGITKTITITPTLSTSLSTSITTIYYTPPPSSSKPPTTVTKTATVVPTITAGPITITKTLTPTPTPKSTLKSTITIWDGAIKRKRSPQTLGFPSRTANTLPTETEYPDTEEEDPEWEDPEYPEEVPTFVLGSPTRTIRVSPTPVKSTSTKKPPPPSPTKPTYVFPSPTNEFSLGQPTRTVNVSPSPPAATSTKKPWWYSPPKTATVTKYLPPRPTGTLIVNSGTLPVLTLGGKRADVAAARGKRQGANADVTRSATFAPGAPVKSVSGFVTSTTKP